MSADVHQQDRPAAGRSCRFFAVAFSESALAAIPLLPTPAPEQQQSAKLRACDIEKTALFLCCTSGPRKREEVRAQGREMLGAFLKCD